MHEHDDPFATPDVALAFASALEHVLRDDTLLAVGEPLGSTANVTSDEPVRVVSVSFSSNRSTGIIALVANDAFAGRLESVAADEMFVSACADPLAAAVRFLATLTDDA